VGVVLQVVLYLQPAESAGNQDAMVHRDPLKYSFTSFCENTKGSTVPNGQVWVVQVVLYPAASEDFWYGNQDATS
jgi:hypothetical protein